MALLPSTVSRWGRVQDKGVSLEPLKPPRTAEAKEHHPNEDKQTLVIQSLLEQADQLPSPAFSKGSKAVRAARKLHSETKRRLQVCWTGSWKDGGGLTRGRQSFVTDLGSMWAFSSWSWVGSRQKYRSWQSMTKSWLFRVYFAVKVVAWLLAQASNLLF